MTIQILLVDDQKIMREGLRAILNQRDDFDVSGEARDGHEALQLAQELQPDVVVMDITLPEMNGIEATRRITQVCPTTRVVALSVHADKRYISNMIQAGAAAYVLKDSAGEDLVRAVDSVHQNKHYLSPEITGPVLDAWQSKRPSDVTSAYTELGPREREVLQLLAEGNTSKEIAQSLSVSVKTVESHRRNIGNKLDLHSIAELTKYAVREGLTSLE